MNRLLLAASPKSYRSRQGNELLACRTEAYPGRSWPPPREVAALVRAEVQAHARATVDDTTRPWWLDGVQLAALTLAALALALVPYLQNVWRCASTPDSTPSPSTSPAGIRGPEVPRGYDCCPTGCSRWAA